MRLAVTTRRGFHAEPGFDELAPLTRDVAIVVDDASPEPDDDVHSTVLFVLGGDTETVLAQVAAVVPGGVDVSPSGLPGSVELTPPGVHKGSGIAQLAARLGVDRLDVVAISKDDESKQRKKKMISSRVAPIRLPDSPNRTVPTRVAGHRRLRTGGDQRDGVAELVTGWWRRTSRRSRPHPGPPVGGPG